MDLFLSAQIIFLTLLVKLSSTTRFVVDIEFACSANNKTFNAKTTLWEDDGFFIFHDLIGHGATYVQGREQLSTRVEGFDPYDLFGYYFEPYLEIEHDCNGRDFEFISYYYLDEPCVNFASECYYNVNIDLSKISKRKKHPYFEKFSLTIK